mgnify:CR=1 FL=1|tara:strand:- start:137 stop:361 length:225 start_codon:yes stop_codon:yes gene_type:complete
MQLKNRLIQEVAKELGIPQTKVREVVSSQTELAKEAMQKKESTSVYLRRIGTFVSAPVKERIRKERQNNKENNL